MFFGIEPSQANKVRQYLDQEQDLPRKEYEERFFLISKAISELDEMLWYILEDAKAAGCTIPNQDLDNAESIVRPEITQVERLPVNTTIDRLIQIGTIKAKLNSILRIAVTNRR